MPSPSVLATPDPTQQAISALNGLSVSTFLVSGLVILGLVLLQLIINWRIASKAGYEGALSLLMLVPLVNFIILLIFAFSEWPVQRRLRALAGGTTANLPPGT